PAGRAAGPDFAVDEEARADDRRIAQPARDLEEEAGRGGAAGDGPVGRDDVAIDRALRAEVLDAVLLDVPLDVRVRRLLVSPLDPVVLGGEFFLPVEPDLAAALGQEVLLDEAVGLRELQ